MVDGGVLQADGGAIKIAGLQDQRRGSPGGVGHVTDDLPSAAAIGVVTFTKSWSMVISSRGMKGKRSIRPAAPARTPVAAPPAPLVVKAQSPATGEIHGTS